MKHCFRIGLYWQGLMHDMSKYSPAEFIPGEGGFTVSIPAGRRMSAPPIAMVFKIIS